MASMVWCLGAGTDVAAFAAGRQYWCGPLNASPSAVTAAWCRLMSISMLARLYGGICAAAGTSSLSLLLSVSMAAAVDAVSVAAVSRATTNEAATGPSRMKTGVRGGGSEGPETNGTETATKKNKRTLLEKQQRSRAMSRGVSVGINVCRVCA